MADELEHKTITRAKLLSSYTDILFVFFLRCHIFMKIFFKTRVLHLWNIFHFLFPKE